LAQFNVPVCRLQQLILAYWIILYLENDSSCQEGDTDKQERANARKLLLQWQ